MLWGLACDCGFGLVSPDSGTNPALESSKLFGDEITSINFRNLCAYSVNRSADSLRRKFRSLDLPRFPWPWLPARPSRRSSTPPCRTTTSSPPTAPTTRTSTASTISRLAATSPGCPCATAASPAPTTRTRRTCTPISTAAVAAAAAGGGGGGEGVVEGAAAVVSSYLAKLSVESFDGDADEELSDEKERLRGFGSVAELTSDSDEEPECYSLPATPPRRRSRGVGSAKRGAAGLKEYASESEGRAAGSARKYARRRIIRERFARSGNSFSEESEKLKRDEHCCYSFSGESEGGGGGLMVITRPKGGRRSLCMDLEEVKACRDLGFELEHERMVEVPSRLSINGSPLDTSSGGNSPIANWRISSPGDDPRDVKARLKVWAQAVAIASTSRHGN
ncbi:uncharacterized protein LOC104434265 [Eucalyptus grandis]|uniref:uncharacterized protein LOC104434265 n=1 Tax=Eucalyptus grandis TaxID=71139 RepID=UPI00192E774E|nr:uncharacterized protein LOC104434265 [Eucalyptus grandis]